MKEQHENDDYSFLQEKIKERPINRKKLLRNSLNTAVFAVVFGLVACFVFILLEPVIGKIINPPQEEVKEQIVLPTEEEEMRPEDMVQDEEELNENQQPEEPSSDISSAATTLDLQVSDYQKLYDKMGEIAATAERSVVKVTGMSEGVDWFRNRLESTNDTSGMIIADNGVELLVLCDGEAIAGATEILVTFCNDKKVSAQVKQIDKNTGFAVLAIDMELIDVKTKDAIAYPRLGSSSASSVVGDLVIAIGSPLGYSDSLCYGIVTSNRNPLSLVDANYMLMTTDIYGSQNASGILVNTLGQVIGIIDQDYNSPELKNQVTALGITEMKRLIEDLSNERETPLLGVYVTDVTKEAQDSLSVPDGAYVTDVMLKSPAMQHGIRKGDVITALNDVVITSVLEYNSEMHNLRPNQEIMVTVMRLGADGYQEVDIHLTLDVLR